MDVFTNTTNNIIDPDVDMVDVCFQTAPSSPSSDSNAVPGPQDGQSLDRWTSRSNIPTGPRHNQQTSFNHIQNHGTFHNDQWNFRGMPSAEAIHQHIMHKKRAKQYYSITTIPLPSMPWKPLESRQDMETRPCFRPASRIHVLACGHHVAVRDTAEPCAANCSHSFANVSESVSIPTRHATDIRKIRTNATEGLQAYIDARIKAGDPSAEHGYAVHLAALTNIWNKQDASLQPTALLTDGDFACRQCGTDAGRLTYPSVFLKQCPYFCIVVGRDNHDLAIMQALRKGVSPRVPRPPPCGLRKLPGKNTYASGPSRPFFQPGHGRYGKNLGARVELVHAGHQQGGVLVRSRMEHHAPENEGKESFREEQERRRHGWLSKRRRVEKMDVLGRLREEHVVHDMEDMSLGGL